FALQVRCQRCEYRVARIALVSKGLYFQPNYPSRCFAVLILVRPWQYVLLFLQEIPLIWSCDLPVLISNLPTRHRCQSMGLDIRLRSFLFSFVNRNTLNNSVNSS